MAQEAIDTLPYRTMFRVIILTLICLYYSRDTHMALNFPFMMVQLNPGSNKTVYLDFG